MMVEWIATAFGLACVWLYVRQSVWAWPTGLVQVCLYAWIFHDARLYSDFLLHLVYIVLQIYGWAYWLRGGLNDEPLSMVRLPVQAWPIWLAIAAGGTAGLGFVMSRFTDADLTYWDAATTVLSLIGTWLLARKVLENWLFWIVVDVLAIGIYAVKELYVTTGLYSVFLVMATMGWFAWRREYRSSVVGEGADLSSASSCRQPAGISS